MKLKIYNRICEKKGDSKRYRREGKIPAVLYVRGKTSEAILIDAAPFQAILRKLETDRLSTTRLTLVDAKGKERQAIVKEIQYHPTTYDILHLDFEELLPDVKVKVKVPIVCKGAIDCVGIKLGGVLRQVIRYVRVQCLPKDMPEYYELDVRSLEMGQAKKLKDLDISDAVRPLALLDEVAVVIAKR